MLPQTIEWIDQEQGHLRLLDQTRLPGELVFLDCRDVETVFTAIRALSVRGAPAIGIAAAYGVCLGVQREAQQSPERFFTRLNEVVTYLAESRPTAVNLFWALDRMRRLAESQRAGRSSAELLTALLAEARAIHDEDRRMCRAIGTYGASLLPARGGVLTHCNTGSLATSELGTALAAIYVAHEQGKQLQVFADETRPLLQGSRLTAWELQQAGVDVTVICDNMAAQVMREGRIQAVIVGADRITANGDTANKIGTYGVALLAAAHNIPFYVAAPSSTFDLTLATGDLIPIEQRSPHEITHGLGKQTVPEGVKVYNPAFDVTPARLIRAIICEHGIIEPVNEANIRRVLNGSN